MVDAGADPWVVRSEGTCCYCHVVDDASVHLRASDPGRDRQVRIAPCTWARTGRWS